VFFIQAAIFGSWLPRIADVKANLALSEGVLGLVLLALPAGTFTALAVASPIIKHYPVARILMAALTAWVLAFALAAASITAATLAIALTCCGIVMGVLEIASNVEADAIERRIEKRIMSRCHGFWSLGAMFGALLGGPVFGQHGVSVLSQFLILVPFTLVAGFLATQLLVAKNVTHNDSTSGASSLNRSSDSSDLTELPVINKDNQPLTVHDKTQLEEHGENAQFKQRRPLTRSVFLMCLIPLGIMAVEGSIMDWSAVFMREQLLTDARMAGYTFAVFSAVMAIVRLLGDWIATQLGDVFVVRLSGIAAALGMALFATAVNVPMALLGAVLAGAGVAIVYPLTMSAVAKVSEHDREDNVAYLSIAAFSIMMIAPPVIGGLAHLFSLRIGLLVLVPGAVLTALLAHRLKVR